MSQKLLQNHRCIPELFNHGCIMMHCSHIMAQLVQFLQLLSLLCLDWNGRRTENRVLQVTVTWTQTRQLSCSSACQSTWLLNIFFLSWIMTIFLATTTSISQWMRGQGRTLGLHASIFEATATQGHSRNSFKASEHGPQEIPDESALLGGLMSKGMKQTSKFSRSTLITGNI